MKLTLERDDDSGAWMLCVDDGLSLALDAPMLLAAGRPELADFGRLYVPLSSMLVTYLRENAQMLQNPWKDDPDPNVQRIQRDCARVIRSWMAEGRELRPELLTGLADELEAKAGPNWAKSRDVISRHAVAGVIRSILADHPFDLDRLYRLADDLEEDRS